MRARPPLLTSDSPTHANLGGWCGYRGDADAALVQMGYDDANGGSLPGGAVGPSSPYTRQSRRPVLEAKLAPRGVRPGEIVRRRLIERVVQASEPVTIVNAPAGYGKTILLSQCAAALTQPVAWVSLDDLDDDPMILLTQIATAVDRIVPVDPMVFVRLSSPEPGVRDEALPLLLNSLVRAPQLVLFLDDVHRVHGPASADVVSRLCEYLPATMRLVLAARDVPHLPLGRLRAAGGLLELGPADLALTPVEARMLLEAAHVSLDAAAFDVLYERTEGWATGLCLAALSARESCNPSHAMRDFSGDDRYVVDYFTSELLQQQTAPRLSFLLRTSVLDRFSAPLCDAVLERADSADTLNDLDRSNQFLVPLDHRRGWYRYHHLFTEMLRTALARVEPGIEGRLHERASHWHELQGDIAEAIEHALAGHAQRRAADLLSTSIRPLFNAGRQATIRRWLEALSDADLEDCPALAAGAAWVMSALGERAATRHYLAILKHSSFSGVLPFGESSTPSAVTRLTATLAWEGVSQMRHHAELAYGCEPPGTQARERAAAILGASLWLRGRVVQACDLLDEAATLGKSGANTTIFALGLLGLIYVEGRQPDEAEPRIREGFALMDHCGLHESLGATGLLAARACLRIEGGDGIGANADLERAVALLPLAAAMPWWSISLGVFTGRAARALGKFDQAESLLAQARRELARYPDAGVLPQLLSTEERALDKAREGASVLCEPLTEAELRVLELAPTHLTLEQIGRDRCISRNTVKTHLKAIYGKLNVSSRGEAVARAQAIGLLRRTSNSA